MNVYSAPSLNDSANFRVQLCIFAFHPFAGPSSRDSASAIASISRITKFTSNMIFVNFMTLYRLSLSPTVFPHPRYRNIYRIILQWYTSITYIFRIIMLKYITMHGGLRHVQYFSHNIFLPIIILLSQIINLDNPQFYSNLQALLSVLSRLPGTFPVSPQYPL